MNWKEQPASSAQLTMIRDLYWQGSDYDSAMKKVAELKLRGITKGEASKEIDRLKTMKANGQLIGNL